MSLLVRHVMAEAPKTASPDMNAFDAAGLMSSYDTGAIPIVEGERLIGLVTDRDLVLRVLAAREDPARVKLGDIATSKQLVTVTPDRQLSEARALMGEHKVRRLPVVKGDALVGIISIGDIAEADASKRVVGETLTSVSASEATTAIAEGPDAGTPERVMEHRDASP